MAFCVGQTTWSGHFGALNAFVAVTALSTMLAMGCASADVEGEPALLKTTNESAGPSSLTGQVGPAQASNDPATQSAPSQPTVGHQQNQPAVSANQMAGQSSPNQASDTDPSAPESNQLPAEQAAADTGSADEVEEVPAEDVQTDNGGEMVWRGQLEDGALVTIHNVTGDMVVRPSSNEFVEVVALKAAINSDPASVSFRVVETEYGMLICTMYPDVPGKLPSQCASDGIELHQGENDVSVRYEIRMPATLLADINTVNGSIRGIDLDGPIRGATVTGAVELNTRSFATAFSVNGDVNVTMGNPSEFLPPDEGLEFKTVTGQVTVTVPANSAFDYEMSSVSRQLESAFPHEMTGLGNGASGRAGQGGPLLELSVVNGGIHLLTEN